MSEDVGSSVPRRRLGRALQELRTQAGITLEAAAQELRCSQQKMRRIETGTTAVHGTDVQAMCKLYDATPKLTEALIALASQTNTKGWWHSYNGPIPGWYKLHPGLEATASRLREYTTGLIPQLLQTREYALNATPTRPGEQHIEERLDRQANLRRRLPPPPQLDAILSEAALLNTVGDPATMAQQLRHLLDTIRLPNVSIRVLPLTADSHVGIIAGSFTMLNFPPGHRRQPEPPVVYREILTGALYLDHEHELAAYEQVWTSLDQLALNEEQSQHLINKIKQEIHHG